MFKKKKKDNNPGQVIFPVNNPNPPEEHEKDVAFILAAHYKSTVEFIKAIDDYKRKSADIKLLGVIWEIKSPKGSSKVTIKNNFQRASKQARNIIIDSRRTKMSYESVEKAVLFEISKRLYLNRVIIIDKSKNIVEIKK